MLISAPQLVPRSIMTERIIRIPELVQLVSLSAATIYRQERAGAFPKRLVLSPHAVGWRLSEVEEWLATRQVRAARAAEGGHNG